ncbi:hypothetical protein UY3_17893 [Chelonia mydas]|uniref:Uncharacterized protein n=1 Tax=Chelonia mydas TaxID=8469 RepID=M7B9Y4_CHEMY|nr:hypothetical protein UY3_17893 [Chelonia mydas]
MCKSQRGDKPLLLGATQSYGSLSALRCRHHALGGRAVQLQSHGLTRCSGRHDCSAASHWCSRQCGISGMLSAPSLLSSVDEAKQLVDAAYKYTRNRCLEASSSTSLGLRGMLQAQGFKAYAMCRKSMPNSDSHDSCLRCLGASHQAERCKICKAFKLHTKKERDFRLKQLLMEAALQPPASDRAALAPASSVQSALASVCDPAPPRHRKSPALRWDDQLLHWSTSPAPTKQHKQGERGRSPKELLNRSKMLLTLKDALRARAKNQYHRLLLLLIPVPS